MRRGSSILAAACRLVCSREEEKRTREKVAKVTGRHWQEFDCVACVEKNSIDRGIGAVPYSSSWCGAKPGPR